MFIKSLSIENFKAIKTAELDFSRINVFTGDNGHGKSSLINALQFPITNDLSSKLENFVHWGAPKFAIAMKATHVGNDIEYLIEHNRRLTERSLIVNKVDHFKQGDATAWLKDNLANPNLAKYSSVSLQHESTAILRENPAPRLEKLKQILGVNELDNKIVALKTEQSELSSKLDLKEARIKSLQERKFETLPEIDVPDAKVLEARLIELNALESEHKALVLVYNSYVAQLNAWESQLRTYETELQAYQVQLDALPQLEIQPLSQSEVDEEERAIQEKLDCNRKLDEYNTALRLYDQQVTLITSKENTYKDKLNILTSKESILDQLNLNYSKIEAGNCPTCEQELQDDTVKLKLVNEILVAKQNITNATSESETAKVAIVDAKLLAVEPKVLEPMDAILKSCDVILSTMKERRREISEFSGVAKVKEKIDFYTSEIERHTRNSIDLVPEVSPFESQIELMETTKELNIIEQKQKEKVKVDDFNYNITVESRRNRKEITELQLELDADRTKVTLLKASYNLLSKEFTSYLVATGTKWIEAQMNSFFQKSYGGKYTVNLIQSKKSVDFSYTNQNNEVVQAEMASGFEQSLLAVSFRLALCSRQPLGIMVLDEIDSDASNEKSLGLYKSLLNEESIKQFFIVTHNPETLTYLQNEVGAKVFTIKDGIIE